MFAQLMSEMLTPASFESFRVYSLDTIARLNEALSLIEDIGKERIPRVALDPVLSELNWSFDKDPVAKTPAGPEIELLRAVAKSTQVTRDVIAPHLVLIKKLIDNRYKSGLEEKLISGYLQETRRIEFRQACGFYCSRLVNIGYSKPLSLSETQTRQ
jgi:hypothetical protein